MKIQIFVETGEGEILIDRTFMVIDERAPDINIQEIVDDAIKHERMLLEDEVKVEAQRLVEQDKAQS
jgi:hypothetical protein